MENFLTLIILSFVCAYWTISLRLEEKDSHEGPFPLKNTFVVFSENGHKQKAAFFDIIRYVFGVYKVEKTEFVTKWIVKADRSEYFTCPFCLSFWVALVIWLVYFLTSLLINPHQLTADIIFWPFAMAFLSAMWYKLYEEFSWQTLP